MTDPAADALARNDRFLHEFVEAFDFCPYAKRCRETGGLERRVVVASPPSVEEVVAEVVALSAESFAHVEVGLLLLPGFTGDAPSFERFVAAVRESAGKASAYYVVGFHPALAPDTGDAARFVSFLRRSPDPTIQLVRASLLERIRGPDVEDTVWVDPSTIEAGTLPAPRRSVSTKIADANFETMQRVGAESLLLVLHAIANERRK